MRLDKTPFIRPILESGSCVHLIARPGRFGKSLFLEIVAARSAGGRRA